MQYLARYVTGRTNNLDFIRFTAAVLVIVSHGFPLSYGDDSREPLYVFSHYHYTVGGLAVAIFFLVSGFLITQSYQRSGTLVTFIKSRSLRIFPGLVGVLLFAVFVVGPLVTRLPLEEYFSNPQTYGYLRSILLIPMQWNLPGVFESNVYPATVNGSLWTLKYEFVAYMTVACLGFANLLRREVSVLLFLVASVLFTIRGGNFEKLYLYFAAGMMFYLFRDRIPLTRWLVFLALGLVVVARMQFEPLVALAGGYVILYMGYTPTIRFHNFAKYGDFSYGLYLYAFPVQQLITYYLHGRINAWENALLAFPLTLALAIASWFWVERPSLKFKNSRRMDDQAA